MSRILLIWELGADYGHISTLLPIALEMKRRGHEPILVLRDLCWAEKILGEYGLNYLQAPLWQTSLSGIPQPISFPEILFHNGFSHNVGLLSICRAWRNLVELTKPDMILFDYAAASLLATLGLNIPKVRIGNGFTMPPRIQPLPSYRWWESQPLGRLKDIEAAVLRNVNIVLDEMGQEPLSALYEMLKSDDEFLFGTPALDHYPQRQGANYFGAIQNLEHGATPNWPNPDKKRIFAYIKTSYPHFALILKTLSEMDASTVVHVPGISIKNIKTYESKNLAFSVDPVRMEDARRQCDVGICHAGFGTTEALLSAGKPVLLLPIQGEQENTARSAEKMGAALWVHPEAQVLNPKKLLKRLLNEPEFTLKAQEYAKAYPERPQSERVSQIVDRCEGLIRNA